MKYTIGLLVVGLGTLVLCGCASPPPMRLYERSEFEFKQVAPATANLTGRWTGSWEDPRREESEEFVWHLTQDGNKVGGTAYFFDTSGTREDVSGQISGAEVSLFLSPHFLRYGALKSSWVGTVSNGTMRGTWYLHGKPQYGYANTGPWSAKLKGPR